MVTVKQGDMGCIESWSNTWAIPLTMGDGWAELQG